MPDMIDLILLVPYHLFINPTAKSKKFSTFREKVGCSIGHITLNRSMNSQEQPRIEDLQTPKSARTFSCPEVRKAASLQKTPSTVPKKSCEINCSFER